MLLVPSVIFSSRRLFTLKTGSVFLSWAPQTPWTYPCQSSWLSHQSVNVYELRACPPWCLWDSRERNTWNMDLLGVWAATGRTSTLNTQFQGRDPQCSFPHVSSSQKVLKKVFVGYQVECLPPQVPFCWLLKGRHATGLIQLFKTLLQFSDEDFQRMFLSGANSQRFCPQHSELICLPQCPAQTTASLLISNFLSWFLQSHICLHFIPSEL